jgi:uncharacterized protein YbgA (DUF1722 family)/uncharacterized protein YbbK (DUF523 family)
MSPDTPRFAERARVRVGVSSCLLGQEVRYDGGHKRDDYVVDTLSRFVTFVPVCPEVELGLGTPRESIRLERGSGGVRLLGLRSRIDHTEAMTRFAAARVEALAKEDLAGYLLKKDSPSCGMDRVKVIGRGGMPVKDGRGLFAARLMERFPLLPVEEEGRLNDPVLRRSFVVRLYAGLRLRDLFDGRWTRGAVVDFHSAEKFLLLSHEPEAYRELGRLVARIKDLPRGEFAARYRARFMAGLSRGATRGRQVNVLQHTAGYFKDASAADRAELADAIEEYRRGVAPLEAPLTLLRHHVRRSTEAWLKAQTWFDPCPRALLAENAS